MYSRLFILTAYGLLFFQHTISAQIDNSTNGDSSKYQLESVSIEELMNAKISVASKNAMSMRETPGIVTVITDEEIKNMGARDLIDILRFVPGMDFGSDIENYVGLGMRGNWASEGKVSVYLDGIEYNELLFGTVPFGSHFSVDNIKKIEIIRGPGSALYGGTSELGVINIITKQHEQEGMQVSAMYGQMKNAFGRMQTSATFGKTHGDWKVHFGTFFAESNRSDGIQKDFYTPSKTFPMGGGNSLIKDQVFNGGLGYKSFSFNFLVDKYDNIMRDGGGANLPHAIDNYYDTYAANMKYEWKLSDKIKITPTYQLRWQRPWAKTDTSYGGYYNRHVYRNLARIEISYDPTRRINIIGGGQFFADKGKSEVFTGNPSFTTLFPPNGTLSVAYYNWTGFVQGIAHTKIVTITAGARYDQHSAGYNAFVPRLGLTKTFGILHMKLLAAKAFRAPYSMNISSSSIEAEQAVVIEAEVGVQLSKFYITVNAFDIHLSDVLVYSYTNTKGIGAYFNGASSGTRGIESEIKYKDKWGYLTFNYSYYQPTNKAKIEQFAVNKDWFLNPMSTSPQAMLGFAPHKLNVMANFKLTNNLNWNINANIYSVRYGYNTVQQGDSVAYLQKYPSMCLMNTFINYDNLLMDGLSLGIGGYNILNQQVLFLTPYTTFTGSVNPDNVPVTNNRAPLPGPSREFVVRLKYVIK